MDFLTDLLPLLIIGALYLLGNIGKLAKKKAEQPAQKQMPQPAEMREVAVPATKKKAAKSMQKKSSPSPTPFLSHDLEHKDARLSGNGPILVEEEEAAPITIASDLQDADEMRKAIVYAEIFNRRF